MFEIDPDDDTPDVDSGPGDNGPSQLQQELAQYKNQVQEMTQAGFEMINIQAQLQSLLHNATVGIISFNLDGGVLTFNRASQQIFGYEESEVLGKAIPHLIPVHNRDHGNVARYLKEFISTRATIDTPVVGRHRNGSTLLLYISSGESESGETDLFEDDPFELDIGAEGESSQMVFFLRDVTSDKQIQEELRNKTEALTYEHRLHEILVRLLKLATRQHNLQECLQASMDIITTPLFSDVMSRYALFLFNPLNQRLELLLHKDLGSQVTESCRLLELGECQCGKTAKQQEVIFNSEPSELQSPCMSLERHVKYSVPIKVENELLGIFVIYFPPEHEYNDLEKRFLLAASLVLADTIQRKRFEQAILSAKEAAEQANHAKSDFLANMSHELRTPMHAILSFANLGLKRIGSGKTEKLEQYFNRVKDSGERLLFLLNDLLDLSKLEAGKMQLNIGSHNLLQVIESCSLELEAKMDEHQLQLVIEANGVDSQIQIDPMRISQVVTNLLSNAIKFSPDGERIHISLSNTETRRGRRKDDVVCQALQLTLSDEGIGIPEEELEKVFDKFIQSSKTKTGAGGTGLGLAICKEIIQGHHGRIWAEGNDGKGASFSFILPREQDLAAPA